MELTNQTSKPQTLIEKLKSSIVYDMQKANGRHWQNRGIIPLTYDEFLEFMVECGKSIIFERACGQSFVIDSHNEPIIKMLYQYSVRDKEFTVDGKVLSKGILLGGAYGSGKSVIMESYCRLYQKLNSIGATYTNESGSTCTINSIKYIKSFILFDALKDGYGYNSTCNLCIDELGREKKDGKIYGDTIQPIKELLNLRYDNGALTHGTTNFKLETLCTDEFYGKMIGDRLKSMFNYIELTGPSRRK